jgi:hypothetical protein
MESILAAHKSKEIDLGRFGFSTLRRALGLYSRSSRRSLRE